LESLLLSQRYEIKIRGFSVENHVAVSAEFKMVYAWIGGKKMAACRIGRHDIYWGWDWDIRFGDLSKFA
jgi:hypothetical protein